MLELQAETSDLALEPGVLVAELAVGRLGARRDPVGVRAHAPAPPVGEMRGVDPLPVEEEADLTGSGAGVCGVEDRSFSRSLKRSRTGRDAPSGWVEGSFGTTVDTPGRPDCLE